MDRFLLFCCLFSPEFANHQREQTEKRPKPTAPPLGPDHLSREPADFQNLLLQFVGGLGRGDVGEGGQGLQRVGDMLGRFFFAGPEPPNKDHRIH